MKRIDWFNAIVWPAALVLCLLAWATGIWALSEMSR